MGTVLPPTAGLVAAEPPAPGKQCIVHRRHSPHVSMPDVHHIWPRGWGGPDVPSNRIVICSTGHRNVHELLDAYARANGRPAFEILRRFGLAERRLAALGWAKAHGAAPSVTMRTIEI